MGFLALNAVPTQANSYGWYFAGGLILVLQGALFALLRKEARRRRAADRAVRRRLEFERLLSAITARLADSGPENTTEEIKCGLNRLRSQLAVDVIWMSYRVDGGGYGLSCSDAGVIDSPALPIDIDNSLWLMARLGRGEAVLVENVDVLPKEAAAEKRALKNQGIRSLAVVPIRTDQSVVGFVVLTVKRRQRGWPQELIGQVQILGDVFFQAYRRQKAENKIREMEQRFVLAADNAPVMIWMSGTDKMCTYFNQCWLTFTGRTLNQELGAGWLEGVHPADLEQCLADYQKAFDARRRFKIEYRLRRSDEEYRWVMDHGVPRYEPGGVFCGYIGSCIDITDLKRSEQELKELSGQLIHAQEDERKRIARELHDDFSQQLTLLGLELAKLSLNSNHEPTVEGSVREVEGRIRELSRAMNERAHQLHSSYLETLGLAAAIQGFCRDFSKQHGIDVNFNESGGSSHLPSDVSLCLFRIVQEGLQNVAKHSKTNTCSVELINENEHVLLRIADAGVGFDPQSPGHRTGLGLISMRERLRLVNGHIQLLSSPKQGTKLEISVPVGKSLAIA